MHEDDLARQLRALLRQLEGAETYATAEGLPQTARALRELLTAARFLLVYVEQGGPRHECEAHRGGADASHV